MQALEFPAQIDSNKQIHLQLPANVNAQCARVIVIYDDAEKILKPIKLGLFSSQITMSDDFNQPVSNRFQTY